MSEIAANPNLQLLGLDPRGPEIAPHKDTPVRKFSSESGVRLRQSTNDLDWAFSCFEPEAKLAFEGGEEGGAVAVGIGGRFCIRCVGIEVLGLPVEGEDVFAGKAGFV